MLSTLYSFNIFSPFLICSSSISAVLCLVAQSYSTLCDPVDCSPPGSSVHEDAPGKNTGVGCHALLQGIFPSEGLNPGLPHCRQIFYYLSHQGSPRILEWVAYPFSRGSSLPRNWTGVSCIAGRFFTNWAIRETYWMALPYINYRNYFVFLVLLMNFYPLLYWIRKSERIMQIPFLFHYF